MTALDIGAEGTQQAAFQAVQIAALCRLTVRRQVDDGAGKAALRFENAALMEDVESRLASVCGVTLL